MLGASLNRPPSKVRRVSLRHKWPRMPPIFWCCALDPPLVGAQSAAFQLIPGLMEVFDKSQRFMPVGLIGRGNRFFVKIDDPLIFV